MKRILLTQGQFSIVDDEDYERFCAFKWYAAWNSRTKSFYVDRATPRIDGKSHIVRLHRAILGLEYGDKRQGDHINHDTLDNRRCNLRIATPAENMRNSGRRANNTSGFKGVFFHAKCGKWEAYIKANYRRISLGRFPSPELAYAAYCSAAQEHHGEFANFGREQAI